MRFAVLALFCIVTACAGGRPIWTPAARITPASCAAPDSVATRPWHLVATSGFSFCAPPDWRTTDGRRWSGSGGSLTWGTGAPPPRVVGVQRSITFTTTSSDPLQAQAAAEAAARRSQPPRCDNDQRAENIGGQPANVYDTDCHSVHLTGATWSGLYFQGEAADRETAALELQVYRTVRFVSQPGP